MAGCQGSQSKSGPRRPHRKPFHALRARNREFSLDFETRGAQNLLEGAVNARRLPAQDVERERGRAPGNNIGGLALVQGLGNAVLGFTHHHIDHTVKKGLQGARDASPVHGGGHDQHITGENLLGDAVGVIDRLAADTAAVNTAFAISLPDILGGSPRLAACEIVPFRRGLAFRTRIFISASFSYATPQGGKSVTVTPKFSPTS